MKLTFSTLFLLFSFYTQAGSVRIFSEKEPIPLIKAEQFQHYISSYFKITCSCNQHFVLNGIEYSMSVGYSTSDPLGCGASDICGVGSSYVIVGVVNSYPYQSIEGTGTVAAVAFACGLGPCFMTKSDLPDKIVNQ